jgi:hypothetical protein
MYPTKQIAVAQMRIQLESMRSLFTRAILEAKPNPSKDEKMRLYAAHYSVMEGANDIARLAIRTCGGQSMMKHLPLERHVPRQPLRLAHAALDGRAGAGPHGPRDAVRSRRDPVITTPQPIHWRFVPVLNPDGLFHQPPRRMNANGVDLNRNFPTPNWERDAAIYWNERVRKDPRRWPGPKAMSEPETKFVHAQMVDFKPDLIVSIHAPYGVLDFDGPSVPPSKLGRLYLDQVGIFPGSLGNYGGVHKGVPVVTVELPNAMRTPLDSETRQMWVDLLRWMSERLGPGAR